MGHRTTHKPGKIKKGAGRPSIPFIIFLALGIALLIWIVIVVSSQPVQPPLS